MGDIADMMLEGVLCQGCGIYIGKEVGFPRSCDTCKPPSKKEIKRRRGVNRHKAAMKDV